MPYTPCRAHGCANLVTRAQKGFCDEHAEKRYNWKKTGAASRGYGWAWQKLRKQALTRDKHLCQMCLQDARYTPAAEVDHITPKARGGSDTLDNLQSLCTPCHKAKTQQDARGRGRAG